jgi:hypothetical protein
MASDEVKIFCFLFLNNQMVKDEKIAGGIFPTTEFYL